MERVTNNPIIRGTKRPNIVPPKVVLLRRIDTALNTVREARAALTKHHGALHPSRGPKAVDAYSAVGDSLQTLYRLRECVEQLPDGKRR